jgi:hypothetical protein
MGALAFAEPALAAASETLPLGFATAGALGFAAG